MPIDRDTDNPNKPNKVSFGSEKSKPTNVGNLQKTVYNDGGNRDSVTDDGVPVTSNRPGTNVPDTPLIPSSPSNNGDSTPYTGNTSNDGSEVSRLGTPPSSSSSLLDSTSGSGGSGSNGEILPSAGSSTLTELAGAGSPTAPLSDTGAGSSTLSELGAVTTVLPTDLTQPPSTTQPQNNPYGSTPAIPNPGQETFNNYISQGNLGGALSNSLFSPYAQAQNSLEAVL